LGGFGYHQIARLRGWQVIWRNAGKHLIPLSRKKMKLRTGFVANSSTGSYLLVGIHSWADFGVWKAGVERKEKDGSIKRRVIFDKLKHLVNADTDEPDNLYVNFGRKQGSKGINLYGGESPYYIGIDVEKAILSDNKFSDMVREFRKLARLKYHVIIPKDMVTLHFGEDGCG